MPIAGIVRVRGLNGVQAVGVVRSWDIGNNGGVGANWQYRASIRIETIDRHVHDVDLLDVAAIDDAWAEFSAEFERKGLITFVNFPGNDDEQAAI
ncbi:hypothetical protein L0Z31_20940 (plasmid) [Burkholderia vietnamiensis]|uniref:hypothetical protein n=1 Tax=Burkholderia vietnamiensis TaxID=60552 RepID=UPI002019DBD2|nr:hypothetical protein [Burkholderia vietnamiensis]MCO1349930.1 hypothetical protein [Burkholderia vietnamiensis]MCO1432400.1 hypothetical protein [Burkholderia vietnamiensis]UQN47437.1 hypothetical protein L0Y95_03975 [Burkholderia vietnamiensis]